MNKYERAILSNLRVMKIMYMVVLLVNLLVPLYSPLRFGFQSITQYILIGIHLAGLLNGLGYFNQYIPIIPVTILRVIQLLWHYIVSKFSINIVLFAILILLDILFISILVMDKNMYTYVRSEPEDVS